MTSAALPLLQVRVVHKHFPGVHVLKGVSLEVKRGEVHALVGENGAGKSTLMHILAGVHQPDSGEIALNGESFSGFKSEHVAQSHGIAIVFQERSLFEDLTVAENIFPHREPVTGGVWVSRRALHEQARVLLKRVGLTVEPDEIVSDLSPAEQQMLEVAKALSVNARLIIFDEPTAALTRSETNCLFNLIQQLKQEGLGIIYISHRLEEVFQITDRVTVLKDGEIQATLQTAETLADQLVRLMVGRDLATRVLVQPKPAPVMLEVRDLSDDSIPHARICLRDISFAVRAGEILGLAGLAGAGRSELALTIFGARNRASGRIFIDGQERFICSPSEAIRAGLGYLPEDRKDAGLFLEMSVSENIAAANLNAFGYVFLSDERLAGVADDYRRKLAINSRHSQQSVQSLSGGNQQKVLLARWLETRPKVLIVDEPTRGVDVGAKSGVHSILFDLARAGAAVVVISSELPEVLALSDRILVMRQGRVAGEMTRLEATEERIMSLASLERSAAA